MKKKLAAILSAALAVLLSLLPLFSAAGDTGTVRMEPVGTADELFSAISIYCNKWQALIGDEKGYDMSFNPDNIRKTMDKHNLIDGTMVTTFDFDGISAEIDDDQNVYALRVVMDAEKEMDAAYFARLIAIASAVAYDDFPKLHSEMLDRFISLLTDYSNFLDENESVIAAGDFAYWIVKTEKGEFSFQVFSVDGRFQTLYFKLFVD